MITLTPRPVHRSRLARTALLIGVSLAAVTACGSDSKTSSSSAAAAPTSTAPTTAPSTDGSTDSTGGGGTVDPGLSVPIVDLVPFSVETSSGALTLAAKPTKIVSLSPTATEDLFAIGAGSQVVAVDDQSNFPSAAAAVASSLSGYTPNVEAIAGYKPDLVVISDDTSGVAEQLTALNIPVWNGPAPV